jgi:hypothetical protein
MKTTQSRDDVRREEKRKARDERFKPQADREAAVDAAGVIAEATGTGRNREEINRLTARGVADGTGRKVIHNLDGEWHLLEMNPSKPQAMYRNNHGQVRHYADIPRPISIDPIAPDNNSPAQVDARGHAIDKQGDKV